MSDIVVYTKQGVCPFCTKAKNLLDARGLKFQEVVISMPSELPNPNFRTVPQILVDGKFIGGATELEKWLQTLEVSSRKTVFNKNNQGHITGKYPLFLGEDLGFADSINQPYPKLEELYDKQMSFIWNHSEVDLTQDRQDMLTAPAGTVDLMVETILWQSLADSVASRAIGSILTKYVSNQALQDWYNAVVLFETIHAKTYLHIIKQCFTDPNEVLKRGYRNAEILKRSSVLVDSFNNLANIGDKPTEAELRKLIMYCVVAMYLLEAINFMASFAVTFGIGERSIFQGITQDVILICRDEMLHAKGGATVLKILRSQWPDTFEELKPTFAKMLEAVRHDEHIWADHAFSNGRGVIGLNAARIKAYVDYSCIPVAETLEIPYTTEHTVNPLPYMDNYTDSSNVQSAAQEIQLTAYLINSVRMESDEDIDRTLNNLKEQYA